MAKFLANENTPAEAVEAARQSGHDLTWITEVAPGADDIIVLQRSVAEQRVLVTLDKDFGELVLHQGKDASCGLILLRPRFSSPDYLARFLVNVLQQNLNWQGNFTVVREGSIRTVPLKPIKNRP
jgi:predicted nuclease of predicted toxin-antitoxin system